MSDTRNAFHKHKLFDCGKQNIFLCNVSTCFNYKVSSRMNDMHQKITIKKNPEGHNIGYPIQTHNFQIHLLKDKFDMDSKYRS